MEVKYSEKPADWPANAREYVLDKVLELTKEFRENPSYVTKERLLSWIADYDLNQRSYAGLYRITDYEVSIINTLYIYGTISNINALKVYLYEVVGEMARLQKNFSYMMEAVNKNENIGIEVYEEGLLLPLKLYYFAYQKFTVEKTNSFVEQLIGMVREFIENSKDKNEIDIIANAYESLLNDLSYMHGNLRDGIWRFDRNELKELFNLEVEVITLSEKSPVARPLKGILLTQISNFVLKSRNNYNDDYICKYLPQEVAKESIKNHEIWMRKTTDLNDDREEKVIPELFEDKSWIKYSWATDVSFKEKRTYYVSSFSKSNENNDMFDEYGDCIYGYKGDRLVELLSPIIMQEYTEIDEKKKTKIPRLSQVLAFDILYDRDEAKKELTFLMSIIDKFKITEKEKSEFLEDILQYWILSVKDPSWKHERERRYVLFIYLDYNYLEMEIDDGWLKMKTSIFLLPDFILGDNPSKVEIQTQIDGKRKGTSMKDYMFCRHCLARDYDAFVKHADKCSICGSKDIEYVYLKDKDSNLSNDKE